MKKYITFFLLFGLTFSVGIAQTVVSSGPDVACGIASGQLSVSGGYVVQKWESGTYVNGVFTMVSETSGSVYNYAITGPSTKYYRALVFATPQVTTGPSVYTGVKTMTVYAQPVAGTLTGNAEYLLTGTGSVQLSGQSGTITWQKGPSQFDLVDITGATSTQNYTGLTETTTYRAKVSTGPGCVVNSNTVQVTVYRPGTLVSPTSAVDEQRFTVTHIKDGGTSTIVQWEISTDNGTTWSLFDNSKKQTISKLTKYRALMNLGQFGQQYTNILTTSFIPYSTAYPNDNGGTKYLREASVSVTGKVDNTDFNALPPSEAHQVTQYVDGFGRVKQVNARLFAPSATQDLIQPVAYDQTGRSSKQYLPYASAASNGAFDVNSTTSQSAFYNNGTGDKIQDSSYPFAQSSFEKSPLGRLSEQGMPGAEWQPGGGHTKRISYSSNDVNEIRRFDQYGASTDFYGANELIKIEMLDEDGKKSQIIQDKSGRILVKRTQLDENSIPWLETYYIYNKLGQVAYIVPPMGVSVLKTTWTFDATFIQKHVYHMKYDLLGRVVEKKVPDQGWFYFCYDRFDRLVLVQDENIRSQNKWFYIKYDRKGRAIMQGLYTNSTYTSRAAIQQNVIDPLYASPINYYEKAGNTLYGYTNVSFPAAGTELWVVNYFDHHDFNGDGAQDYAYVSQGLPGEGTAGTPLGLATGSKRLILDGTGTNWLVDYLFYDADGRLIQSRRNNHLNVASVDNLITQVYDFEGKLKITKSYHNAGSGRTTLIINKINYDHAGRVTQIFQNNNNAPADQLVVQYEYNELGQLIDKKLHNTSGNNFLQSVDLRYSIQGWLTSINNAQLTSDGVMNDELTDYFGMELLYEKIQTGLTTAANSQYNGNVSAIKWKGTGVATGAADQRSYKFTYDKANRFKTATSQMSTTATSWTKEANALNESITNYDFNGNILGLQRMQRKHNLTGSGVAVTVSYSNELIDNLTYTYGSTNSPDQLTKVTDATNRIEGFSNGASGTSNDFTYNSNGDQLTDLNKGITTNIVYNAMGKPTQVIYTDGRKVEYVYDVAGAKLGQKMYDVGGVLKTTTDYIDQFIYENGVLSQFTSPEGRVIRNSSGGLEYQYLISDHQGNTRVVFSSVNSSETHTASFENITTDAQVFKNVTSNTFYWVNSPNAAVNSGLYAMRMNSTYNPNGNAAGIGPAKSISVMPGDVIDLEVYAYYQGASGFGTASQPLATLINAVAASITAGMPAGEATSVSSGISGAYSAFGKPANQGDAAPSAFLNYILLDKDYKVLDMGWQAVPTSANGARQKVSFTPRNIKEPGYMYVYLSYEGDGSNWVYFDDLKITHTKSNVIQYNDYYPFGLQTATSWTRENSQNSFLYNGGSELNKTTGLYEMLFRNYDPALGRLTAVDPMAMKYASLSKYHYAFNNPIAFNDPSGAEGEGFMYNQAQYPIGYDGPVLDPQIARAYTDYRSTQAYVAYVKAQGEAQQARVNAAEGKVQTEDGTWVDADDYTKYEVWEYEGGTIVNGEKIIEEHYYFWQQAKPYIKSIKVDLTNQVMTLEWAGEGTENMPTTMEISSGNEDKMTKGKRWRTPTGKFKTTWKYHTGATNKEGQVSGKNNSLAADHKATWAVNIDGAIFFHYYPTPDDGPQSHACVRIRVEYNAELVWRHVKLGVTDVEIFGHWPHFQYEQKK